LAIRQGDQQDASATDLLITRVSANVLADSRIGFIYTDGDPTSNLDNSVSGIDFQYINNDLSSGIRLAGTAFFQQSDTPGLDGEDASYGFNFLIPSSEGFRTRVGYKVVEENFNPAMGFVNRSNIEDLTADFGYTHFFNGGPFQTYFGGVDMQRIELIDGGLQSEVYAFRLAELETTTRDRISVSYFTNKEVVRAAFPIFRQPGNEVFIQPGSYDFNEHEIRVVSGGQREFSMGFTYRAGDFYNGERVNMSSGITWAQSRYFQLSVNYDWNDIDLPQGDFITRLSSVTSEVAFSSTLYWISLIQYDNISEEIGINTRLQWIPRAGQEGFIVLNYGLQDWDQDNTFNTAFNDLSIKFRYTFRF